MTSGINWRAERRSVSELIPAEYNPRQLTEKQAAALAESLDRFSLADPIIINANNRVIGGHQRINVLKSKGVQEVDVRVPDRELTLDEEMELNIRLNKNLGEWNFDALANFDEGLLKSVGFDSKELDRIFQLDDERDLDDAPAEKPATDIKAGDLFDLGGHRLLCGDSTKREDVERLMGGVLADMVHTDPPYNVDYGASKKPRHKIRSIQNDSMPTDEWEVFCRAFLSNIKEFAKGDIYMWGASGPEGIRMRLWLIEMGCHWSATIIWNKDRLVLSPANYQRKYEPCFYGWFDKSSYCGSRKETEVWDLKRPTSSKLHPTMKPIEVCQKAVLNSSPRDGVVLDLFLGSGSTLIACEVSARKCYGIELEPGYCQVIIDRWEKLTGKKAEKIG